MASQFNLGCPDNKASYRCFPWLVMFLSYLAMINSNVLVTCRIYILQFIYCRVHCHLRSSPNCISHEPAGILHALIFCTFLQITDCIRLASCASWILHLVILPAFCICPSPNLVTLVHFLFVRSMLIKYKIEALNPYTLFFTV